MWIHFVLDWLGIVVAYVIAGALIAGGGYLALVLGANPLNPFSKTFRYGGMILIALGLLVGAVNYGKSIGAAGCKAEWAEATHLAEVAKLKQEANAKSIASETSAEQSKELASDNDTQQESISDYRLSVSKLSAALATCRLPSGDDDRRVCELTGNAAPGCANTK